VALRNRLTTGKLFDLFEAAATFPPGGDAESARDDLYSELERRTRWDRSDLEFLAGSEAFDLNYPDDWKDERALKQLDVAISVVRHVGLCLPICSGTGVRSRLSRQIRLLRLRLSSRPSGRAMMRPVGARSPDSFATVSALASGMRWSAG
jgi:hypothetical protein